MSLLKNLLPWQAAFTDRNETDFSLTAVNKRNIRRARKAATTRRRREKARFKRAIQNLVDAPEKRVIRSNNAGERHRQRLTEQFNDPARYANGAIRVTFPNVLSIKIRCVPGVSKISPYAVRAEHFITTFLNKSERSKLIRMFGFKNLRELLMDKNITAEIERLVAEYGEWSDDKQTQVFAARLREIALTASPKDSVAAIKAADDIRSRKGTLGPNSVLNELDNAPDAVKEFQRDMKRLDDPSIIEAEFENLPAKEKEEQNDNT